MKNKLILFLLVSIILLSAAVPTSAAERGFLLKSPDELRIGDELYLLALLSTLPDEDFSVYALELENYLASDPVLSASTEQKYALMRIALGTADEEYVSHVLDRTVGKQGVMSLVFGLHIVNNTARDPEKIITDILSARLEDGGWALFGESSDVDVTAMTLQALAPYYSDNDNVRDSVDSALAFISQKQLTNGGFSSFGVDNCESCAQVLLALSSLGIDCRTDERFIKNGRTVIDRLEDFRLDDGSFSHTENGASNAVATSQSALAFAALENTGKHNVFLFKPAARQDGMAFVSDTSNTVSYKPIAAACILGAAVCVCAVLLILKKRNIKNFIFIAFIAAAGIALILFTDFSLPKNFYGGNIEENYVGYVTVSVGCETLIGKSDSDKDYIPSDGIVLAPTPVGICENDTVYDVLVRAARENSMQTDISAAGYVRGLNYIYEFDFGPLSGWIYRVNGVTASVGCAEYKLSNGDAVQWLYSCDMGEDLD